MKKKNTLLFYRNIFYKKYNIIEEFETPKAYFFKVQESKKIFLIKALKYNNFFYTQPLAILKKVKLKNVIELHDYSYNKRYNYIKIDYFENSFSLRYFLNNYLKNLKCDEIFYILNQIAEAIDSLHRVNISHFDITYENIMVNDKYEIKIIDFDLMKIIDKNEIYKLVDISAFSQIIFRMISHKNDSKGFNILFNSKDIKNTSCHDFLHSIKIKCKS